MPLFIVTSLLVEYLGCMEFQNIWCKENLLNWDIVIQISYAKFVCCRMVQVHLIDYWLKLLVEIEENSLFLLGKIRNILIKDFIKTSNSSLVIWKVCIFEDCITYLTSIKWYWSRQTWSDKLAGFNRFVVVSS